jgi:acyl carrier protein
MSLEKLLSHVFDMKPDQFLDETSIMSFAHFDSMNHMIFITEMEALFQIELSGDEIAEMITVGDIKNVLKSKGCQF